MTDRQFSFPLFKSIQLHVSKHMHEIAALSRPFTSETVPLPPKGKLVIPRAIPSNFPFLLVPGNP